MKIKAKLRHFWRNNKSIFSMYMTFFCTAVTELLICIGAPIVDIVNNIALALVWSLVWSRQRQVDIGYRFHVVNKHRCKKYINEMHTRGLKEGHQVGYDSGYNDGFQEAYDEMISNHDNQP